MRLNKDAQKDKSQRVTHKYLECRDKSIKQYDYVQKNWVLILLLPQDVSWQLL